MQYSTLLYFDELAKRLFFLAVFELEFADCWTTVEIIG